MTRSVTTLPITEYTVGAGHWDTTRAPIDRIVIHTMVGTVASANATFNTGAAMTSAHYGVGYDGKLYHWVDEDNTAYHAGVYPMNQRSIGIEHEDKGQYDSPRPDALYAGSAKLVADICKFYNIPCDRQHIIKHNEVPYNTHCCGTLDIDRIVREAQAILTPPQPVIDYKKKYEEAKAVLYGMGTSWSKYIKLQTIIK